MTLPEALSLPARRRALSAASVDELLEELARRRSTRDQERPVDSWCHDCGHFQTWTGMGDAPRDFNACSKGHAMQFRVPADYGDAWGFYRRVCADRLADEADDESVRATAQSETPPGKGGESVNAV